MLTKLLTVMMGTIFLCVVLYVAPIQAGNPQPIITEPVFLGGANPNYYKNKKKKKVTSIETQDVKTETTKVPVASTTPDPIVETTPENAVETKTEPEIATTQTTPRTAPTDSKTTESTASIGIAAHGDAPTAQKPVQDTKPAEASDYDF
jgi:hypothetical protein